MRFVAALTALALPLAIAPGLSFFHDVTPKLVILLVACAAAILATAFKPSGIVTLAADRAGRWMLALLGALILVTVVSTFLAPHRELAVYGSNWRRLGLVEQVAVFLFAACVTAAAARSAGVRLWFLRGLCIAGVVAALYGILQYFGLDPLLPANAYHAGEGPFRIVRPPSTLGHSDYFGAFTIWPVFLGFGLAMWDSSRYWRIAGWSSVVVGLAGMLSSGSRAPLLGLAAGGLLLIFLLRPRVRIIAAVLALAGIALAGFYLSPAGAKLRARVHWITEEPAGGARLLLWRDTLRLVGAHPLEGVGPENFVAEFPRFQSLDLARAYPDFYHESPHNFVLDMAAGQGIVGAALLLALCGLALAVVYRRRAVVPALSAALGAGLLAAMVAHQFTVFTIPDAVCFFTIMGLSITVALPPRARPVASAPVAWKRTRYVGYAAALAASACLLWVSWRAAASDRGLALVRDAMDAHDYERAARVYRSIRRGAAATSADLYFSRRWAAAAAEVPDAISKLRYSQVAMVAALRATRNPEQRPNAWYNLAAFEAIRNNARGAEMSLRSAIQTAPNWFKPHWTLARLLGETGRINEARQEALRATELNAGKDAQVTETARRIGAYSQLRR